MGEGRLLRRGAELGGIGLQAQLLVVLELADNHATELLAVAVTGVQQLAHLGRARGLVDHQLVVLAHQQLTGQQRVQALVQARLRHLTHHLLPPTRDPAGRRTQSVQWRGEGCKVQVKGFIT